MVHHAVLIENRAEAKQYLEEIGVSSPGIAYMVDKAVFRCIKLKHISHRAANILKQEMLAKGGEAAVTRDAAGGEKGFGDVLLLGTLKHYTLLLEKLKQQPFGLRTVAAEIENILQTMEAPLSDLALAQGKNLALGSKTVIMGILNITPDSFSDGGRFLEPDKAYARASTMQAEGADIIDIGGASSRPDSIMVSEAEELARVIPLVKKLVDAGMLVSVDTFRAEVARQSLENGAHLINDIGSLQMDSELLDVLIKWQAPVVLMHNRLQLRRHEPYVNLIDDIAAELAQSAGQAEEAGLGPGKIILDPGLGFGKSPAQNRLIIKRLGDFKSLGWPLLIGASRKSFIGKTLGLEVEERLEGSLAVMAAAIMNGADIVRVHDVQESCRMARMLDAIRSEHG
ncbi:MAG TPA: dihydropteroate synthase [Syntrophomonas sp.]|nr:dihydropteroate synthase [Syntrophomonas sp.]